MTILGQISLLFTVWRLRRIPRTYLAFAAPFFFIPTHSLFLFASLQNMWKKKTHSLSLTLSLSLALHTLYTRARTHTHTHTHTHTNAHKAAAAIPGMNKRAHSNPLNAHSAASVALDRRTRAFIAPKINPAPRKVRLYRAVL